MTQEIIKDIRIQLRRFMNGVVSDSMRRNGIVYKLNFGVSLPRIKQIAASYTPDKELAEQLWQTDVRELKILAFFLYPPQDFSMETAENWVSQIRHLELAEQFTLQLLRQMSYAESLAQKWIVATEEYIVVTGFLLFARLCAQDLSLTSESSSLLLRRADEIFNQGISRIQRAALTAIKRYGRQNKLQAEEVLRFFASYLSCGNPEKEEFYKDLQFEFEENLL